jgi:hypothetical protein
MTITSEQQLKLQAQQAARDRQAKAVAERKAAQAAKPPQDDPLEQMLPAVAPKQTMPVVPDTRTPQERYLDEIAPVTFAGQLVKFSKDGEFVIGESGEKVAPDRSLVALCDETLVGWIKFGAEGEPPIRVQGLHYDGFVMPERESLGDLDQSEWPEGLNGQPADPWQHQICEVLQDRETGEFFTFATSSVSGRRAVGNLLRHYERLRKSHPDTYPVVNLKPGGFNHRDPRVGWVPTPTFAVVGRAQKDSAAIPNTAPSDDLEDAVPF